MMRVGRNNNRALEGNFRLPAGCYEMVDRVDKLYKTWYKLWKDAVVPKLIRQPKWFKTDKHLEVGDLVYFEKDPSKLSSVWVMGRVDQVIRSADGLIREAVVAFRNHSEAFNRLTNRAVRSLVRMFSIDEECIQEDLARLQKRIDALNSGGINQQVADQAVHGVAAGDAGHADQQGALQLADTNILKLPNFYQVTIPATSNEDTVGDEHELVPLDDEQVVPLLSDLAEDCRSCNKCCCPSHCQVRNHHTVMWKKAMEFTNPFKVFTMEDVEDEAIEHDDTLEDNKMADLNFSGDRLLGDCITDLLLSVNTNLSGKV